MLTTIKHYILGMRLSCRDTNGFLADYLAGDIPPRMARRFESHIAICANCRAYLDQYRDTVRLLQEPPPLDPPPEFVKMTQAFLDKELARRED